MIFGEFIQPISLGLFLFALFGPAAIQLPNIRKQPFSPYQVYPWFVHHAKILLPNTFYTFLVGFEPLIASIIPFIVHYGALCALQWGYILLFMTCCFGAAIHFYLKTWTDPNL